MTFLKQTVPDNFSKALNDLTANNHAVRCLSWMIGDDLFYQWASSIGVSQHSALRDASSPIPPTSLRSIVAAPDEETFLWTGARDISNFMRLFYEHSQKRSSNPVRVFDFGCGCGRLSRFLNNAKNVIPFASEINPDHVAWCANNLSGVTTKLNGGEPPIPFDDGAFDFAYSLSIFSHLNEALASVWLKDLARVMASGGILIITTHGYPALEIVKNSEIHQQMFQITPAETSKIIDELESRRYIYRPFGQDILDIAKAGPSYGNTFMHLSYAAENWNKHALQVVQHIPGGLGGWQDIFILRKS